MTLSNSVDWKIIAIILSNIVDWKIIAMILPNIVDWKYKDCATTIVYSYIIDKCCQKSLKKSRSNSSSNMKYKYETI